MHYSYSYSAGLGAAFGGIFVFLMLVFLAVGIVGLVSMWKIFEKAGYAGWKALIPIYNMYCLFEMTWGNGWLFLLCLVPLVNIVVLVVTYVKLAQAFGQSGLFAVGLLLLSVVFMPILAFGAAEYQGVPVSGSQKG